MGFNFSRSAECVGLKFGSYITMHHFPFAVVYQVSEFLSDLARNRIDRTTKNDVIFHYHREINT